MKMPIRSWPVGLSVLLFHCISSQAAGPYPGYEPPEPMRPMEIRDVAVTDPDNAQYSSYNTCGNTCPSNSCSTSACTTCVAQSKTDPQPDLRLEFDRLERGCFDRIEVRVRMQLPPDYGPEKRKYLLRLKAASAFCPMGTTSNTVATWHEFYAAMGSSQKLPGPAQAAIFDREMVDMAIEPIRVAILHTDETNINSHPADAAYVPHSYSQYRVDAELILITPNGGVVVAATGDEIFHRDEDGLPMQCNQCDARALASLQNQTVTRRMEDAQVTYDAGQYSTVDEEGNRIGMTSRPLRVAPLIPEPLPPVAEELPPPGQVAETQYFTTVEIVDAKPAAQRLQEEISIEARWLLEYLTGDRKYLTVETMKALSKGCHLKGYQHQKKYWGFTYNGAYYYFLDVGRRRLMFARHAEKVVNMNRGPGFDAMLPLSNVNDYVPVWKIVHEAPMLRDSTGRIPKNSPATYDRMIDYYESVGKARAWANGVAALEFVWHALPGGTALDHFATGEVEYGTLDILSDATAFVSGAGAIVKLSKTSLLGGKAVQGADIALRGAQYVDQGMAIGQGAYAVYNIVDKRKLEAGDTIMAVLGATGAAGAARSAAQSAVVARISRMPTSFRPRELAGAQLWDPKAVRRGEPHPYNNTASPTEQLEYAYFQKGVMESSVTDGSKILAKRFMPGFNSRAGNRTFSYAELKAGIVDSIETMRAATGHAPLGIVERKKPDGSMESFDILTPEWKNGADGCKKLGMYDDAYAFTRRADLWDSSPASKALWKKHKENLKKMLKPNAAGVTPHPDGSDMNVRFWAQTKVVDGQERIVAIEEIPIDYYDFYRDESHRRRQASWIDDYFAAVEQKTGYSDSTAVNTSVGDNNSYNGFNDGDDAWMQTQNQNQTKTETQSIEDVGYEDYMSTDSTYQDSY